MAPRRTKAKRNLSTYAHRDKDRVNNPPVGLVTTQTDEDAGIKSYAYDPHLDPELSWTCKAEHTSFEVPTVSLHVHERIDPRTIIEAVRKRNGPDQQPSLFDSPEENPPLRHAIDFYKHRHNWTNRLIAGDSLLVMNSLIEKEGLGGQLQVIYMDPPYGITYDSNFQPFVDRRTVNDKRDADLTHEPEAIRAFRDTWELGIHSYLSYIRDRLLLAHDLLHQSGSCFVQISDKNVHHIRELMDEVFGATNFVTQIYFSTTSGFPSTKKLSRVGDYLLWYARDRSNLKYRSLFQEKENLNTGDNNYKYLELPDGSRNTMSTEERSGQRRIPKGSRIFTYGDLQSSGPPSQDTPFEFNGKIFRPNQNNHWKASWPEGMDKLKAANRIGRVGKRLRYVRYLEDYPVIPLTNSWMDTSFPGFTSEKQYVVETNPKVIQRCILMTSDPGDLVFDPTCGSGTTAYVSEQWGRRWITCDTSRVALTLAKQRLMTANFDYYELARPNEGVGSGFRYKTAPHVTLESIANNPEIKKGMSSREIDAVVERYAPSETLFDQPYVDKSKARVTGPFTVEAVPAAAVRPLDDLDRGESSRADLSVAKTGATARLEDWREELLNTGIRGKAGQHVRFVRLEPLPGLRNLHAEGEITPNIRHDTPSSATTLVGRTVVSFGPDYAPLEQRQVELAIEEARRLVPQPTVIVFAAFQFDPEAAKDIDETNWPGVTLLKTQMNADLLTHDLKKKRTSNESFWLVGQPDVRLEMIVEPEGGGVRFRVSVKGFDYYDTRTGIIQSGSTSRIALWMLDPDYDGRSLFPRQVFLPMAGGKRDWSKLEKSLKAEIDSTAIAAYRGTSSLPFTRGTHSRAAIKIVDDRGVESLKLVELNR